MFALTCRHLYWCFPCIDKRNWNRNLYMQSNPPHWSRSLKGGYLRSTSIMSNIELSCKRCADGSGEGYRQNLIASSYCTRSIRFNLELRINSTSHHVVFEFIVFLGVGRQRRSRVYLEQPWLQIAVH